MAAPDTAPEMAATPKPAAKDSASCSVPTLPKPTPVSSDEMRAVARKFASQPVQNLEPGVWAVLTGISKNARVRPEGMNILLSADEHIIGRMIENPRFRISSVSISGKHCKIYRDLGELSRNEHVPVFLKDTSGKHCKIYRDLGELSRNEHVPVFLKDTSTNGTYINWKKLMKDSPPTKLNHGDIISFTTPPHNEASYAYVYREVNAVSCLGNGTTILKRKSGEFGSESKRLKGLGIGSPDGPVSLDDVRRLEKSNADLRGQLEAHVITIETLRTERKIAQAQHEKELKELKETTSSSYLDQTKSLHLALEEKQKQLNSLSTSTVELQNCLKDLDERLSASKQSRADADEIIRSQKANICELEGQLTEERNLRIEERDKAAEDLKSALHKVQAEAQEEIKRQTETYLRQQREQQDFINKLQETEKETRALVDTLRSKLEDSRESLVRSEKKIRELEVQLQDEQLLSANNRKKSDNLETEVRNLKKELENEKVAREEAWAKVSALELEIDATIKDLSVEKRRYQGARERIILRESQLRTFYSTTEEISSLFAKQQEQLKSMQRTLEDDEKYESTLMGFDLKEAPLATVPTADSCVKPADYSKDTMEASGASTQNTQASEHSSSGEDANMTEQQDGGTRVEGGSSQDLECASPERSVEKVRSDSHGDLAATAPEQEPTDTEQVPEIDSQAGNIGCSDRNSTHSDVGGETMQIEDEMQPQDGGYTLVDEEPAPTLKDGIGQYSEEKREPDRSQSKPEDSQATLAGTVVTADLLASELPGSWAVETGPSVNGENESPRSSGDIAGDHTGRQDDDIEKEAADGLTSLMNSDGQTAGSQSNDGTAKLIDDPRAIGAMMNIIDPKFRRDSMSDAETEEGSEAGDTDNDSEEAIVEDSVG